MEDRSDCAHLIVLAVAGALLVGFALGNPFSKTEITMPREPQQAGREREIVLISEEDISLQPLPGALPEEIPQKIWNEVAIY